MITEADMERLADQLKDRFANEKFLTIEDVANTFSVSQQTVKRWAKNGLLPKPIRITTQIPRWRQRDINNWIRKLEE